MIRNAIRPHGSHMPSVREKAAMYNPEAANLGRQKWLARRHECDTSSYPLEDTLHALGDLLEKQQVG